MVKKAKQIVALILSMLMILSSMTVYAADDNTDTQPVVGHTLTVNVIGEGSADVTGEEVTKLTDYTYSVSPGTTVTVRATPGEGMQLSGITLDGILQSESFLMPEQDAVLEVSYEAIPQQEEIEKVTSEDQVIQEGEIEENAVPDVNIKTDKEISEKKSLDEDEYVTNSKGITVLKSLLCDDPNCLEQHVGVTLDPIPEDAISGKSAKILNAARLVQDPYIGMTVNGKNASVLFLGVPGTNGDFSVTINDGALAGTTGTGTCVNHGAANPGENGATICTWEATCTAISGSVATWSFVMTPPGACTPGSILGYQRVGMVASVPFAESKGSIELKKSSANPELTANNNCYSLAGAVYGVYSGKEKIAELTTDNKGYAKADNIPAGNYTVKEITVPKGYAVDLTTHNVTVVSGQTATVTVSDVPQSDPVTILLGKVDAETTQNMPQGSASLEGAEFTVKFYGVESKEGNPIDPAEEGIQPLRTWVVRTDERGFTRLGESYKVSGDEFYKLGSVITLPLGILTIQETKAPEGYLLNDEVFVRQITSSGTAEAVETYNAPTIPEEVIKGNIQIIKYGESNEETDDSSADIKHPLEGVKFHLTSKTTQKVYTIITDEQGIASTTQLKDEDNKHGGIPFDTYIVTEESPYPEYDPVAPFEVTVNEEGKTYYYILRNDTVDAPIQVQKIDETTGKVIPIAGAKFQILDSEKNPIKMTVSHYPSLVETDTFETDVTGMFVLPEKLEYGTYYLHEVKAPEGYLLSKEDIKFVVDKEYQWEEPLTVKYADKPAMGRIKLVKTDAETGDTLEGAEFEICAAEDIVTPDGTVRTAKGEIVDTISTDDFGRAESKNLYLGKYEVRETKTLPGYYLPADKVWEVELVYQDQNTEIVTETLEIENIHPEIETTARDQDTGTNQGIAKEQTTIIDTVEYKNVNPGTEYTIKGVLMNKETGEPLLANGEQITAEKTFTPEEKNGSIDLEFTFDSSALEGKAVVVFESLYEGEIEAAVHADITDEGQTVEFPEHEIGTTAIDKDTGTHQGIAKKDVTIVDTVEYTGLIPGQEYTVKGILMNKETGEPLLVNGEQVTAEKTFTAEKSEGSIDIEFTFDASELSKEVVVFEHLYAQETEVATHTDINDEGQTVSYKVGSLTVDMPGNKGNGISVKTGDNGAPIFHIVGAMLIAVGVIGFIITSKRGKRREENEKEE